MGFAVLASFFVYVLTFLISWVSDGSCQSISAFTTSILLVVLLFVALFLRWGLEKNILESLLPLVYIVSVFPALAFTFGYGLDGYEWYPHNRFTDKFGNQVTPEFYIPEELDTKEYLKPENMEYREPIFNKYGFIAGYTQKITSRAALAENELVNTMKEAIPKYDAATSVNEFNKIDADMKALQKEIRAKYTEKELDEAQKGSEYNSTWRDCYKAVENAAHRLGVVSDSYSTNM